MGSVRTFTGHVFLSPRILHKRGTSSGTPSQTQKLLASATETLDLLSRGNLAPCALIAPLHRARPLYTLKRDLDVISHCKNVQEGFNVFWMGGTG